MYGVLVIWHVTVTVFVLFDQLSYAAFGIRQLQLETKTLKLLKKDV